MKVKLRDQQSLWEGGSWKEVEGRLTNTGEGELFVRLERCEIGGDEVL